jgi:hypothetical protein
MARNATTYHHNNDNAEFGFYWWALEVAASPNPAMVRVLLLLLVIYRD